MSSDAEQDEERPGRPAGLDPIARALRATYDAENHDSLGQDLTGLMLQLARVEEPAPPQLSPPPPAPALPAQAAAPAGWWGRLFGRR